MTKLGQAIVVVMGTLLVPIAAGHAQSFAGEGRLALSAERLFGLVFGSETTEGPGGASSTDHVTTVSLLFSPVIGLGSSYSTPRLALDYFVTDGLSLGAAVGLFSMSMSNTTEAGGASVDTDGPSFLGGLIAPRVGYALTISDSFAIWPRAGITFMTFGSDIGGTTASAETSASRLAVTLEGWLVIGLAKSAALLLGPTFDIGVSGTNETTSTGTAGGASMTQSVDVTGTDIGVHAGLAVAF